MLQCFSQSWFSFTENFLLIKQCNGSLLATNIATHYSMVDGNGNEEWGIRNKQAWHTKLWRSFAAICNSNGILNTISTWQFLHFRMAEIIDVILGASDTVYSTYTSHRGGQILSTCNIIFISNISSVLRIFCLFRFISHFSFLYRWSVFFLCTPFRECLNAYFRSTESSASVLLECFRRTVQLDVNQYMYVILNNE